MKNLLKKLCAAFLTLAITVGMVPAVARAEEVRFTEFPPSTVQCGDTYFLKLFSGHIDFEYQKQYYEDKVVKFQSSNKKIATVNSIGLVRFKKPGKVKITAKAGIYTAKCTFTVEKSLVPKKTIKKTTAALKKYMEKLGYKNYETYIDDEFQKLKERVEKKQKGELAADEIDYDLSEWETIKEIGEKNYKQNCLFSNYSGYEISVNPSNIGETKKWLKEQFGNGDGDLYYSLHYMCSYGKDNMYYWVLIH